MKKIFYFIVAACLMTACVASEEGKTFTPQQTNYQLYIPNYCGNYGLYKFTYENHNYILIKGSEQIALEHDPNCQCHYDF